MSPPLKILAFPIFRRHWLYHAWYPEALAEASVSNLPDWRKGAGLEEKIQLLSKTISTKIQAKLVSQWRDFEQAKYASFKNRLYRLAQAVLAREHPEETFLKAVPSDMNEVDVIYPSSCKDKLVRRRLRLLVRQRVWKSRCRLASWSLATIPLIPLLVTPVPNLPLYYAGYRVYSHAKVLSGCNALQRTFSHLDTLQLQELRSSLLKMQEEGVTYEPESWAAKLIRREQKYLDILENIDTKVAPYYRQKRVDQLLPRTVASSEVDAIVQPAKRRESPLGDDAAMQLGKHFGITGLLEHVARARRTYVGAMFPIYEKSHDNSTDSSSSKPSEVQTGKSGQAA